MKKLFVILALLVFAQSVEATTWYVRTGGSDSHNCTQAQTNNDGNAKLTINSALACAGPEGTESGGNTVQVAAGTYTDSMVDNIPSGSGSGALFTLKCETDFACVLNPGNANFGLGWNGSAHWVVVQGFKTISGKGWFTSSSTCLSSMHDIDYINNEWDGSAMGGDAMGLQSCGTGGHFRGNIVHNLIGGVAGFVGLAHGIYVGTRTDGLIIENNQFYSNGAYNIQVYDSDATTINNVTIRNNITRNAGLAGMVLYGTNFRIYNNLVYSNTSAGILIRDTRGNSYIANNTLYANGGDGGIVNDYNNPTTVSCVNNLAIGNTNNQVRNCTINTTNVTTGAAASHFVNPGTDFSLIAGSGAIDAGTAAIISGVTACFNGSAPDAGAIETLGTPTATVNGADAVITVPNNCTTQMLPASSVTGWTFKKNGSGDTVTANSRSGSNSFAATLTSAFVGGDTCLFSYSQSGNTTSDNNIGNLTTSNQEILAFTDSACTNITAGGGATLAYTHGRWYLLQGATDTAWIPKAAADTNVTVAPGSKLNLRWKVKNTGGDTSLNPRIRVAYDGGSYVELTSSYVNAVKALGSGVQLGTVMTDGSPMTQDQLTSDVANIACTYIRNPVSAPNLALTTNTESECGAAIDFDTTAVAGKQYDFKLYDDVGTAVSGGPISVIIGGYSSVR